MKELRTLNKYLVHYKWKILLGALFILVSNFLSIYMVEFVGKALNVIEEVIKNSSDNIYINQSQITQLLKYGALIIGLPILAGIMDFYKRQTIIVASRWIEYDLKNDIFQHYEKLDLSFYKKNKTGDLMNRISEDVGHVRMYLGPGIMYPIDLITRGVILITVMLMIDKTLTLYTLAPLPILSVLIYFISSRINLLSKNLQEEQSNLSSYVQDMFSGIRVIKAYNKEGIVKNMYSETAKNYKIKALKLADIQAYFFPLMLIVIGLSQILILYAGGVRYINGDIKQIGVIAQFFMYLNLLIWPFTSLGWVSMVIQRAAASMQRINEFLHTKSSIKNEVNETYDIKGSIAFDKVNFTYDNTGIQALKNISFSLPEAKTLAVMGKTGSGKSTLALLIARMYDPNNGTVKIDGKPLKEINLNSLRSQIGFVPQEAFLFSDTILNNITFALDEKDLQTAEKYAKEADVDANIKEFKDGYYTKIGERGVTLSGGQKQRVSIARALVKDPPILIFDDSLSAVDTETEENILNNIKAQQGEKTMVIVTHRVSSAKHADHIIILEDGELLEQGTPEELYKQNGVYRALYNSQLKDEV